MYIVKLIMKDRNGDFQFIEITINESNKEIAIHKAIIYYYKTYWTNTEHKKEDIDKEMNSFKKNLDEFTEKCLLKSIPNKGIIISEYLSQLRSEFGAVDKSIDEFSNLSINSKLDYLFEIGCELTYIIYPAKTKFEKVKL